MRRTSQRCGKQAVGCDGAPLELPKIVTREKPVPPSENSLLTPDKSGSGDDIEESNDLHVVDVDGIYNGVSKLYSNPRNSPSPLPTWDNILTAKPSLFQ